MYAQVGLTKQMIIKCVSHTLEGLVAILQPPPCPPPNGGGFGSTNSTPFPRVGEGLGMGAITPFPRVGEGLGMGAEHRKEFFQLLLVRHTMSFSFLLFLLLFL